MSGQSSSWLNYWSCSLCCFLRKVVSVNCSSNKSRGDFNELSTTDRFSFTFFIKESNYAKGHFALLKLALMGEKIVLWYLLQQPSLISIINQWLIILYWKLIVSFHFRKWFLLLSTFSSPCVSNLVLEKIEIVRNLTIGYFLYFYLIWQFFCITQIESKKPVVL